MGGSGSESDKLLVQKEGRVFESEETARYLERMASDNFLEREDAMELLWKLLNPSEV